MIVTLNILVYTSINIYEASIYEAIEIEQLSRDGRVKKYTDKNSINSSQDASLHFIFKLLCFYEKHVGMHMGYRLCQN